MFWILEPRWASLSGELSRSLGGRERHAVMGRKEENSQRRWQGQREGGR